MAGRGRRRERKCKQELYRKGVIFRFVVRGEGGVFHLRVPRSTAVLGLILHDGEIDKCLIFGRVGGKTHNSRPSF